jgi:hypothetical protein
LLLLQVQHHQHRLEAVEQQHLEVAEQHLAVVVKNMYSLGLWDQQQHLEVAEQHLAVAEQH